MVRTTKADKTATATPAATTPVVEAAATPATKAPKTPKTPKTETAPAPVAVAPVAVAPVVEATPAPVDETKTKTSSEVLLSAIDAKIQQVSGILSSLKSDSKDLRKQIAQDRKAAEKAAKKGGKRKSKVDGEKAESKPRNSGFMKPVRLSDELATFLGKSNGAVMGRQDANAEIRNYVATHGLKETAKGKGRNINPDAKLSALLKIPSGVQLDYFNLQKYMKPHFIKIEETASA